MHPTQQSWRILGDFVMVGNASPIKKKIEQMLNYLIYCNKGWLDLNMEQPVVRSLGNSEMLLWELREGFYVKAFSQSRGQFADALQFVPLDHETPDPPPLMFDFVFSEFTTDPAQDLIAMISGDPNQSVNCYFYSNN
jgi:hypothetical protein